MKKILTSLLIVISTAAIAQNETMEKRAKEMIRVIALTDKAEYRKFIKENYTEEAINRPVRRMIAEGDNAPVAKEEAAKDPIEGKVAMYAMFHEDMGAGKILSTEQKANQYIIKVRGDGGATMIFTLTFQTAEPYLIDRVGADLTMTN